MTTISSEVFVQALCVAGFAIYRSTSEATILERGGRAVTIPTCPVLDSTVVMDLRRMAGLSLRELDVALAAATSEPVAMHARECDATTRRETE